MITGLAVPYGVPARLTDLSTGRSCEHFTEFAPGSLYQATRLPERCGLWINHCRPGSHARPIHCGPIRFSEDSSGLRFAVAIDREPWASQIFDWHRQGLLTSVSIGPVCERAYWRGNVKVFEWGHLRELSLLVGKLPAFSAATASAFRLA